MSHNHSLNFEHCFSIRVYVEDTDLQGIVYHANYLRFFERSRTEWLRSNGFTLTDMAECDTNFAIRSIQLQFVHPARLDDLLMIKTNAVRNKHCGLRFNQAMFNASEKLLSTAVIEVVCVNKKLKPIRLPEAFISTLKQSITMENNK